MSKNNRASSSRWFALFEAALHGSAASCVSRNKDTGELYLNQDMVELSIKAAELIADKAMKSSDLW